MVENLNRTSDAVRGFRPGPGLHRPGLALGTSSNGHKDRPGVSFYSIERIRGIRIIGFWSFSTKSKRFYQTQTAFFIEHIWGICVWLRLSETHVGAMNQIAWFSKHEFECTLSITVFVSKSESMLAIFLIEPEAEVFNVMVSKQYSTSWYCQRFLAVIRWTAQYHTFHLYTFHLQKSLNF